MGDILGDLSNAVPQLRDIAGELNKVSGTMSEIGSRTKSAGSDFRDLYGGEFDRMTTHAKAFNLAMRSGQDSFIKFKKNLHQIEEGFGLMRTKAIKELGITGKFFGDVFKRMEQTGKSFAKSLGKELLNTFKGMAKELLSFKNVFSLTFSVISASVGIVYKVINGFIDAIKKGWEITTKWLNELYAASGGIAQSLGLSTKSVGHLRGQIESLYISNMNLADSMADIANAASEAMQAFREVNLPTSLIDDIFKMGKSMGFTNTQASKLSLYLDKAWGVKGSKERKVFVSEQLQFAKKIGVPYKEITGTLTDQLDLVSRLGSEGVVAIHRLGAASKSFGVSQEKIIANMAKFDTLEETIPTINKINLLTGAAIDPFLMFAETDPTKKFAHMFEQIRRGVGDFKNLDKWTKLSLANISGFTESEMEMIMSSGDVQKKIEETMKKGEGIKKTTEAWNDAVIAAKSFFVDFDRLFRPLFSQISKIFMGLAPSLVKSLQMVLKGFGNFLNGATSPIKDLLFGEQGFSSALENWAKEAMELLSRRDIQEKAADFIRDMKETFIKATGWIDKMIDALKERLPGLMDQFRTFFNTVVDKIQYVLKKIEKHNVLGTLERGAKLFFKTIDFIVKNKTTLLTLFGAFKVFSFVSAIQNGAMASRNLRNIAQLQAIGNVTNQTFKTEADAINAAKATGLGENFAAPRKEKKRYVVDYNYPGPTAADRRAEWWGQKKGRTTRAGFAGGLGMTALMGATQLATGNVAGGIGAIAGGVLGSFFGPMGAMIGSTIGSTIGEIAAPKLVKLFKTEMDPELQTRVHGRMLNTLNSRIAQEKKLSDALEDLTKNIDTSKNELFKLSTVTDVLKDNFQNNKKELNLTSEKLKDLKASLDVLAGSGILTSKELKKLYEKGGILPITKERYKEIISKLEKYNELESIRIQLLEKNPEIIKEYKERKTSEKQADLSSEIYHGLFTSFDKKSKFQQDFVKGFSPDTIRFLQKHTDLPILKDILTASPETFNKSYLESKTGQSVGDDLFKEISVMREKYKAEENIAAEAISKEGLGLAAAAKNYAKTMADQNKLLLDFPDENKKSLVLGVEEGAKKFNEYLKEGKRKEADRMNIIMSKANTILSTDLNKNFISGMLANPKYGEAFGIEYQTALSDEDAMVRFLNKYGSALGMPVTLNYINEAANREYADGGPILTNTVLSTIEGGRLRPYATAGEPGNPESVVPDRNKTVSVNLTIPVYLDGKKITDVVVNRILPLNT